MNCFVTGTDTGVGKTWFTARLLTAWRQEGHRVCGFKPISTGDRGDAEALHAASGRVLDLETINPFHFEAPLCPWLAARREYRTLNLSSIAGHILFNSAHFTHNAVEGVGGWLAPLTERETVRELAQALSWPVVIVARASLGTLNHSLLTVESVRHAGLPIAGLVMNTHGCTADEAVRTNPAALQDLTRLPVAVIGPETPFVLPDFLNR